MARYTGPKHKLCRAEGFPVCGSPNCPVLKKNAGPPGQHSQKGRRKLSEYGVQLREKQKVKRIYGVMEKQFKKYYQKAAAQKAATGEALLSLLETRLDNVIYRLGFAKSRPQARQMVSHDHILVNDKKVNIPSYNVKVGDVISLSPQIAGSVTIKKIVEYTKENKIPQWVQKQALVGKISSLPKREDLDLDINERLIVEYYSR